ncbi:uncharacterized protein LOC111046584 isoform X1 [Nilaparvata lugens]|uniref:uncharacterized protein LOC111046584 isoform X1 n=1 Tax=Nilaparvata lugens TaxID=108931 RepID=UPI000B984CFD|nr:uncharacterized protein LOC111046584 isoform X1 [Nilaparvata lugens]
MRLLPLICLAICFVLYLQIADAVPTMYQKNSNHMLEPVLIPVSSTVIPLPVYKVGAVVGIKGDKPKEKANLITAAIAKKKLLEQEKKDREAKIKPISKEDFLLSKDLL